MLTPVTNGVALPVDIDTGRVLAPGETAEADLDHPHNEALVVAGALVVTNASVDDEPLTGKALDQRAADLDIEGRSDMNADQKRAAIAQAEAAQTTEPEEAT